MNELKEKLDLMGTHNLAYWDLEVDTACNFKYYFRKFNPDQLSVSYNQRRTAERRTKRTGTTGYRPIGTHKRVMNLDN
jgi:hypothetical protein